MFKRFRWLFIVMLPVGAIGGLLVMAVVSCVMPRQYESEAIVELQPIQPFMMDGSVPTHTKPQDSHETEIERIKSRASMAEVVDRLLFTNRWRVSEETAIRILTEIVSIKNILGTDLIAIRVRHTDRKDARDITAELARICQKNRMINVPLEWVRYSAELDKAVMSLEGKVDERRKALITLARTGSFLAGPNMTEEDVKKAMYELRAQDLNNAKRNLETDQALLQSMKLKQLNATVATKLHNKSIVIHEYPTIAQEPVSPNVALNLILGAVGGGLLTPLLALPVMLLLNRSNPRQEGGLSGSM